MNNDHDNNIIIIIFYIYIRAIPRPRYLNFYNSRLSFLIILFTAIKKSYVAYITQNVIIHYVLLHFRN